MVTMAELQQGMKVRSSDGHGLGKIIRLDSGMLVIEKGFFFPKDYEVPLSMVSDVRDGEAILSVSKEALEREGSAADLGASGWESRGRETGYTGDTEGAATWSGANRERGMSGSSTEETRVQLAEEELQAEKRTKDAGEVRVRKEVVTEHKTIDVPVTREEVHVERVPVSTSDASVGRGAFEEKTIVVPVREEEVRVTKRPRVREEVRVSKTSRTVEQRADADVRHEEARIERTDDEGDRGGLLGRSDEERTTGYGTGERDDRGGGILGLGRDDEPTNR